MTRRLAENGEDERDAAADCFCAIGLRCVADPELLLSQLVFPGYDGRAVEEDLAALAGGEDGCHFGLAGV
jgi:hypothetical protein